MHAFSTTIYLFPGQGADHRIFSKLEFDTTYKLVYMTLPTPERKESLQDYAYRFIEQINQTEEFILIGVSLGGMICSELADTLTPSKTILISSAKCRSELPKRYRFQKFLPLNKCIPAFLTKWGALLLQPLVEPDRNNNKETFKAMLKAKKPKYLKRTVNMIINWDKESYNENIIHIHGTNDHTIPSRNVKANALVEDGSHMMTLTRASEINTLLNTYITDN
jgi:pimeloyl-ACP methyl ester carboxylesterase